VSAPKIVWTERLDAAAASWLGQRSRLVYCDGRNTALLARELADAQGLLVRTYTRVDARLLELAPGLRVVGRAGAGLDNIDLDACRRRGVRVVYTPDANTQAVVEYVWASIFDALRPRPTLSEPVAPDEFDRLRAAAAGRQADALVLGILGMGRIGRRVAEVARAFGMRTICHDLLTPGELGLAPDAPARFVERRRLWSESDLLTIHIDGREQNRGLFGALVLAELKPSCVLINTSRGSVVDGRALAAWARRVAPAGGGAILDVHEPEPPPDDYPLFGLPNVRLLPHIAARTDEALRAMSEVVRDVARVLAGEEPWFPAA
jgi:phosphoglycerate dehydrogenase-like enzyme